MPRHLGGERHYAAPAEATMLEAASEVLAMDTGFLLLLSLVLAIVLLQAALAVRRVWRGRHP